jgi:hypothetical protein
VGKIALALLATTIHQTAIKSAIKKTGGTIRASLLLIPLTAAGLNGRTGFHNLEIAPGKP